MKQLRSLTALVTLTALITFACSSKKKATSPTPAPPPPKFSLENYREPLDTSYFKVWSDSSWNQYGGKVTINSIDYLIIENNLGNQYYYSAIGYAGYKPANDVLILFDHPLPFLANEWTFGVPVSLSTTFTYGGYLFTLTNKYTLVDTSSVGVSFGTFNPCPHFSQVTTLSASGQSEISTIHSWLAQGPGSIRYTDAQNITILMVRGHVNGQLWGSQTSLAISGKRTANENKSDLHTLLKNLSKTPL